MNSVNEDASLQDFDLQPDPRVLPMLGEINIDEWRCIAELIDNSIDGFLSATRAGASLPLRRIDVSLPNADREGVQVKVTDTGPGMTPDVLQRAVSAGWSGNNPIDNLGLFGMGFNIATARLGTVTEVWTTRKGDLEWHGLVIDFEQLRRQRHFRTRHLTRPKPDPLQHGTEVIVKSLKPDRRRWLAKAANQTSLRKRLAQSYSAMLRQNGIPLTFDLFINNRRVEAWQHCVWGEERGAVLPDGEVRAVIPFSFAMAERPYCTHCMTWLSDAVVDQPCPVCTSTNTVTIRQRRVSGWLGLQRYLDQSEYGIDFIRNGRKIEIANKDLFLWRDGEGETREYPIDDPRGRGRLVGEVHIDHCRVSYAKDYFDRNDPSWNEMIRLLRGEGPLRPEKAKSLGFSGNDSPLFRLFKAFRRTSPQSKTAGAWARILITKDNERAVEMARLYHEGNPEYQDDTKWWELVQEADRDLLYSAGGVTGGGGAEPTSPLPGGLIDPPAAPADPLPNAPTPSPVPSVANQRRPVPSLSRKYIYQSSIWTVEAYEVAASDQDLPSGSPWAMPMGNIATRTYNFLFQPSHAIFSSITLTPRDALLIQLSWLIAETLRTSRQSPDISAILAELRANYGEENLLDPRSMSADAAEMLVDIAKAVIASCAEEDRPALFNELPVPDQQAVMRALAAKRILPTTATADGSFLQYAPYEILRSVIEARPELCFDGRIWDDPHESLDYGDKEITDAVRNSIKAKYISLINDVILLARQESRDLAASTRDELIRAMMSLRLLRPDAEIVG